MIHLSTRAAALTAAWFLLASAADGVRAQCTTCATPTVAYSPVVAAPVVAAPATVVVQRPGFFDRWRMRRWGVTAPVVVAPTYAAGYAPSYTAAYAPTYTAAYAPTAAYATPYTAGYTPYYSAYAPLQSATVYRPAVLSPVVASYAPACDACTTCSYAAPACDSCAVSASYAAPACSSCSASESASAYVQPAGYAAPASGCACEGNAVSTGSASAGTNTGDPYTPIPAIPSDVGTPVGSGYPPTEASPNPEAGALFDGLQAPQLMAPVNDHTASRPSVEVHTAVYRRPIPATGVSTSTEPTRAVDEGAWDTVPTTR